MHFELYVSWRHSLFGATSNSGSDRYSPAILQLRTRVGLGCLWCWVLLRLFSVAAARTWLNARRMLSRYGITYNYCIITLPHDLRSPALQSWMGALTDAQVQQHEFIQTDRQTDRQMDRYKLHRHRQTYRDTQTNEQKETASLANRNNRQTDE